MAIEVLCPECESTILCPEEKIGKAGRCPKCGTRFEVPDPEEPDESLDIISFLCPNGHKLTGPPSIQGRPGQCPHCDARFIVPDYSDEDEEFVEEPGSYDDEDYIAEEADEDLIAEPETDLPEIGGLDELAPEGSLPDLGPVQIAATPAPAIAVSVPVPDEGGVDLQIGAHPMAQTFDMLWALTDNGGHVELHLKNGDAVRPEHYAAAASRHEHGYFAIKTDDGRYTVTAIAWDSVARVTVRGAESLPPEIFGL